jgi:GNAT superfamily N-acetyltransferase
MAHGELYAAEYGWDQRFEELVAGIVGAYATGRDPRRERGWIAEVDGERAGCILCTAGEAGEAKLRVLLVDPRFRGHGVGAALVGRCLDFARAAGYRRMVLWTTSNLTSARRIYQAAGFELVREQPHSGFGREVVGQDWALDLVGSRAVPSAS